MHAKDAAALLNQFLRSVLQNSGLDLRYTIREFPPGSQPMLLVTFEGPDVPRLLAQRAELLLALEHLAAKVLRLESGEHELISFDAGGFKGARDRQIRLAAARAVEHVLATGRSFAFQPMNSRERRLLHLALASSGLISASVGEGAQRHIVLHPTKAEPRKG